MKTDERLIGAGASHQGEGKACTSPRRRSIVLGAAACVLAADRAWAQTEDFPKRPITIVVPYTPGSATDILGRLLAEQLSQEFGQPVVVENKPGAGGSTGTALVAKSKNDGYTMCLVSNGPMAINATLYKKLGYDPVKDFTPVIRLVNSPSVLLVSAQSPDKTVQDLMRRLAENKAGSCLQFGSAGVGTPQHLTSLLFAKAAEACAEHVPYRGPAEQLVAVSTQEVAFSFANLPSSMALVKQGRLRALAVTSTTRSPLLPEVPPLADNSRTTGFERTSVWFGLVAARDTPPAIVSKLHAAFAKIIAMPAIQARLVAAGFDIVPLESPADFGKLIEEQVKFWGDLVRVSGATVS